ncbi:MAG: DNA translocase FtsK [Candidatus Pacebacteria bacterium]|nr:DNA translocase FtsK [Candidatus Paceibacterota bacterium]
MAKNKNQKNFQKKAKKTIRIPKIYLPEEAKNWIWGILLFIFASVFLLSFFHLAGIAGDKLNELLQIFIGKTFYLMPLIFVLGGAVFFTTKNKKFIGPTVLAILILVLGISGILEGLNLKPRDGGLLGYVIAFPFLKFFSPWVSHIVFGSFIVFGGLIFWYLLKGFANSAPVSEKDDDLKEKSEAASQKPSFLKKIFFPKFKIKEIEPKDQALETRPAKPPELKTKEQEVSSPTFPYQAPPIDLLDSGKESPTSGDIRANSAIIKKTLQNFDISVEMSEVNIGPTVTQYSFKPAEGVKLSKITGLSNDLSLSLAAHPIRIEAPIPGRSLVGVEVPNRVRAKVRLRDLVANPIFQQSSSILNLVLGRDVSGSPVYADISRMPHLLIGGSTGTGKTIFLNSLILSLIYRNSPEMLNFILIDPKRVEFPVYNDLPHLLAPVILDASRAVNALKWLISEMERRFDVLSAAKARDILSYNQQIAEKSEVLPYIVVIIDELADLMAARGRDMEAGIVRLAQMARAVGIHLVVATQRPSVEVITGLIKANITSRVTFQVASQVDSRTVLDAAGAEKLLGAGDLLFISAEIGKPKRIQGAYVSDKEVKRVVNYIKSKNIKPEYKIGEEVLENQLREDLEKSLDMPESEFDGSYGDDPLYEEAQRVVTEARKASASLLQRRLRIGYARAARLIDMLEEKGVVGPGEGAKPREVFVAAEEEKTEII